MGDLRQAHLTKLWCEKLYPGRYGMPYPWSGKEAKSLQRVVTWADKAFGKDAAQHRIETAMAAYLRDEGEWVVKNKHPFGSFSSGMQRWFDAPVQRKEKRDRPLPPPIEDKRWEEIPWLEDEAAVAARLSKMTENQLKMFVKGMALLGRERVAQTPRLRMRWRVAVDLYGKDRVKQAVGELVEQRQKDSLAMALTHIPKSDTTGV